MDPTVAGALIGGGLTVVGSLGSQWISAWRANTQEANAGAREESQANRARIDYLREVLEAAALALHEAGLNFDNAGNTAVWIDEGRMEVTDSETGEVLGPRDAVLEQVRVFQESLGQLWREESRLGLLVPRSHGMYVGLHAAGRAYYAALDAFARWHKGELDGPQLSAALRQAQQDVASAETRFFDGSRSVVGPNLDPPGPSS